jgi:hypothetical protein
MAGLENVSLLVEQPQRFLRHGDGSVTIAGETTLPPERSGHRPVTESVLIGDNRGEDA